MQAAILLMLTGAVIAGANDLTYSLPGYVFVAICVVSTALYLLLIRLLKDSTGMLVDSLLRCYHCRGNSAQIACALQGFQRTPSFTIITCCLSL